MLIGLGTFILRQVLFFVFLIMLPLTWLFLAGRTDVVVLLLKSSDPYGIWLTLTTVSFRDSLHATGVTAIITSFVFNSFGSILSFIQVPLIGAVDKVIARGSLIFGVVVLLLAYNFGLYN